MSDHERGEQIPEFMSLARGPKGDRGDMGAPGKTGAQGEPLSKATRRAIIFLFVLSVALAIANLLWSAHLVRANNESGCGTIEQIARIPVPRPVAGNPSRQFAAALEAAYRERGRQLGCRQETR